MTRTVFVVGGPGAKQRIAYRVKNNAAAYALARRKKWAGYSAVVTDPKRTKYEEARIDGATGDVTFHQVNAPGAR